MKKGAPMDPVALRQRLAEAIRWPTASQWLWCAGIGAGTLAAMAAIGFASQLYRLTPGDLSALPLTLLTVFFVPALGEELVFRGLLTPTQAHQPDLRKALVVPTALYVLWHPLEAYTFLPGAKALFTDGYFLLVTTILGLSCGLLRWRTGSIWPAVILHWLLVVIWKTWLGGPSLSSLS